MKIRDLLQQKRPTISFEIFPPKTEAGMAAVRETLRSFVPLQPDYVSVTYGAMGSTQERTLAIAHEVKHDFGFEAMCHLTCVGHAREQLAAILDRLAADGIENLIALRGDPPQGMATFQPVPGGFRHASELVAFIKSRWAFGLAVAGYPEKHIEAPDAATDLAHLKEKVDAGGEVIVTQLFFDNRRFFDFVARCRKAGISVPIVAGIMPISNADQIKRFTQMCGATIPPPLLAELERHAEDPEAVLQIGIDYATRQCAELIAQGVAGLHFYTLNKSRQVGPILAALGHGKKGTL